VQSSYLESLYELYLKDPQQFLMIGKYILTHCLVSAMNSMKYPTKRLLRDLKKKRSIPLSMRFNPSDNISNSKQVKVIQLIQAYRNRGHYKANVRSIGLKPTRHCDDLELSFHDLKALIFRGFQYRHTKNRKKISVFIRNHTSPGSNILWNAWH